MDRRRLSAIQGEKSDEPIVPLTVARLYRILEILGKMRTPSVVLSTDISPYDTEVGERPPPGGGTGAANTEGRQLDLALRFDSASLLI